MRTIIIIIFIEWLLVSFPDSLDIWGNLVKLYCKTTSTASPDSGIQVESEYHYKDTN